MYKRVNPKRALIGFSGSMWLKNIPKGAKIEPVIAIKMAALYLI